MAEILKVEDEANNIIYDAKKKAGLIEAELEKEIEKINNELEKEFNEKVNRLKAKIQKTQKDEAKRLEDEFEEKRNKLSQIDKKDIEKMINLIIRRICEA
jgi:vacuolar-type H+-ATPase subunit H